MLTNSSYMPQHHKCNNGNDAQSNPAIQKRLMATSSTSNFATAGKAASNLTRALQNVRYIPFIFSHLNAILYFIGDPHMRVSYVPGGGAHGDRGHCPVSIASDVGSRLGMRGAGHIQ